MKKAMVGLMWVVLAGTQIYGASVQSGLPNSWYGGAGTGTFTSSFASASYTINALVVDSQNRSYLIGYKNSTGSFVMRVTAMGTLDTSYGNGYGYVLFEAVSSGEQLYNGVVDANDNLYVCGGDGTNSFAAKLTSTGAFASWGDYNSGIVASDLTGYYRAYNVALTSGGALLVCGDTDGTDGYIAKFTAAGELDSSFSSGGVVTVGACRYVYAMALNTDNSIIVVAGNGSNALVLKYTSAGEFDSSFGTGGFYVIVDADLFCLTIQQSGKIVVGGSLTIGGTQTSAVARLTAAGALDTSFGTSGYTKFGDNIDGDGIKVVQSDIYGRLILAGNAGVSDGNQSLVVRLSVDGILDTTFSEINGADVFKGASQDNRGNVLLSVAGTYVNITSYTNYNSSIIGISSSSGPTLISVDGINRFILLGKPLYRTIISASEQAGMSQQERSFNSGL